MLRRNDWIIFCILQLFNLHCNGDASNKFLYSNETLTEDISPAKGKPILIKDLRIINTSSDSLTISWNANHENVTSYSIIWYMLPDEHSKNNASIHFFTQDNIEFTIELLKPCSIYNITVTVETAFESEAICESVLGETAFAQPGVPLNLTAHPTQRNDKFLLDVSWEMPAVASSCIQDYLVVAKTQVGAAEIFSKRTVFTNVTFPKLLAHTSYKVSVQTTDQTGARGLMSTIEFKPAWYQIPASISNLHFELKISKTNANTLDSLLFWNLTSANLQLRYFRIDAFGWRIHFTNHTINTIMTIKNAECLNTSFTYNFGELRPEYDYQFSISAAQEGIDTEGPISYLNIKYPPGIPPQPRKGYIKSITLNPSKTKQSLTSAQVLLPLFSNANGRILYYAILVSKLSFMEKRSSNRFNVNNENSSSMPSWRESMENDFEKTYQATETNWSPYPNYIINYGNIRAVKVVIGDDTTCKDISTTTKDRVYCNGPLKPDTWYEVRIRAFTAGGYADSTSFIIKTEAEINVAKVVGIVVGVLLIGILLVLLIEIFHSSKISFEK